MGINIHTKQKIYFESLADAGRYVHIAPGRISDCCKGTYNKSAGHTWSFIDEIPERCIPGEYY